MTGVNLTHIPYKGAGPMMQDLLAGQVDMAFDGMSTSAPQIKARQAQGPRRDDGAALVRRPERPDHAGGWLARLSSSPPGMRCWATQGTPKEVLDRMYQETVKAMRSPELKKRLGSARAPPPAANRRPSSQS